LNRLPYAGIGFRFNRRGQCVTSRRAADGAEHLGGQKSAMRTTNVQHINDSW